MPINPFKLRRLELGLKQYEVARAAGITVETLSRVENGHENPNSETLDKLAAALRCRPSDLLEVN